MSRPQKRKSAVRQVGVFMMVDTSAVFRTFFLFFWNFKFSEKKKKSCYQDLATTYSEDAERQKGPSSYTA